jgi:hypothetical protein
MEPYELDIFGGGKLSHGLKKRFAIWPLPDIQLKSVEAYTFTGCI